MNRDRDAGATGFERNPGLHPDAHPTGPIRRPTMAPPPGQPPPGQPPAGRPAAPSGPTHSELTQPIPAVTARPPLEQPEEQTQVIKPVGKEKPSLLKSSGSMAIATLISRITGFGWKLLLAWMIGTGANNDSFTVANNLPNSVFELLIGGVLTSVIVPVLVRAEKSDSDRGEAYIQRLLSLSLVVLAIGTAIAVIAAPVLVSLFISDSDAANPALANAFAYLLLPQIFFYGLSALASAILQAKQLFSPPAWAPVINNLVVITTLVFYSVLPGAPLEMTRARVLTLGIGVTLGVVCQAFIQVPALRKTGLRFRWRWGWDPRLSEFGGLALWMITYVAISLIGLSAMSQVGTSAAVWSQYNYVWMLLQLPYGVIGFSVMTAILPRMSSAAADGDHQRIIDDLSLGNRLSTVTLLPISAVMAAVGLPIALALFSIGKSAGDANQIGIGLAVSAFGVLPYAITMMQMRVFYALKDARTPTLIMIVMTVLKIVLSALCYLIEDSAQVLYALTFINSFTFVVGWLVGEVWLRHRLGPLGSRKFLVTLGKTVAASVLGGALAWLVSLGVDGAIPGPAGAGTGWLQLTVGSVIGFAAIFGLMSALRVSELQPAIARLTGLLRRR